MTQLCQLTQHLTREAVKAELSVIFLTPEPESGFLDRLSFNLQWLFWVNTLRHLFYELAAKDEILRLANAQGAFTSGPRSPINATDWSLVLQQLRLVAFDHCDVPEDEILRFYRQMRDEWQKED